MIRCEKPGAQKKSRCEAYYRTSQRLDFYWNAADEYFPSLSYGMGPITTLPMGP